MTILYLTGSCAILFIEVEILEENAATFSKPFNCGTAGTNIDLSFFGDSLSRSTAVPDDTKPARIWI